MKTIRLAGSVLLLTMVLLIDRSATLWADDGVASRLLVARDAGQPADLDSRRRVHAPYSGGEIAWEEAGIFWFGRVDPPGAPGQNYADVRVGYNNDELTIHINVEDYYVWYDTGATASSDLTRYDAVAVYLDTAGGKASSPQPSDYVFLSGLCLYNCGDGANHRREARGTGTGWDWSWSEGWTDNTWASWYANPGPNDGQWDYGWWSYVHIPWHVLGLSGPPDAGTLWGLGVVLHDRDAQPPAGALPAEHWPEAFDPASPLAWGELAFGLADYVPPLALYQGTTIVRRGLNFSVVEDASVGADGSCSGGHEGDPEHDNNGEDTSLYVESQSSIADFPCFSKSFLRFNLNDIPPDKVILSATLTLHHWGNARPDLAQPSLIWLFTVDGGWEEHTLTWNSGPLARENLTRTWVDVLPAFPGWPGVPYDWDATQAVSEAYAAGEPLNVALYTADTEFHSAKYLTSSDAGDWNAVGRPTLTIEWGEPLATVRKNVSPVTPQAWQVVTYELSLLGNGESLVLTDDLPAEVGAPGAVQVSGGGTAGYDPGAHRLTWSGFPGAGESVTITFAATVEAAGPLAVWNTAMLTSTSGTVSTDSALMIVDAYHAWLPLSLRNR